MNRPYQTYPGGKAGSGVYQAMINMMPAHDLYIEPFLGNGSLLRAKEPARRSIGIDRDHAVVRQWKRINWPHLRALHGDGIAWLAKHAPDFTRSTLIYCDPPYVLSTRTRRIYQHEMSDLDHRRLLRVLLSLDCHVIISGYDSAMYRRALKGWSCTRIKNMTRGGQRWECVWSNFNPAAIVPHDVKYAGSNYRERLNIKRKSKRWADNFTAMAPHVRQAILAAITTAHFNAAPGGNGSNGVVVRQRQKRRGHLVDQVVRGRRRRDSRVSPRPTIKKSRKVGSRNHVPVQ